MRFAIASTEYFQSLGFNTEHWRKNLDGTEAVCHAEFALTLGNARDMDIYEYDSEEFLERINGEGWVESYEELENEEEEG